MQIDTHIVHGDGSTVNGNQYASGYVPIPAIASPSNIQSNVLNNNAHHNSGKGN